MRNQVQPNFHFFGGRENTAFAGIRHDLAAVTVGGVVLPSIVLGPKPRNDGSTVRWAKVIAPDVNDRPEFRGEKIVRGSIVKVGDSGRDVLVSHRDEHAYYVLVRTGLRLIEGSTANDLMALGAAGINLKSHGSYSFDSGSFRIADASNENDLGASVGRVAAERLDTKTMGRKMHLIGCPESTFVLWRVPVGAVLLVRDINGKLTRLVGEKDGLRVVDAPANLGVFFDQLEDAHRQKRARK